MSGNAEESGRRDLVPERRYSEDENPDRLAISFGSDCTAETRFYTGIQERKFCFDSALDLFAQLEVSNV